MRFRAAGSLPVIALWALPLLAALAAALAAALSFEAWQGFLRQPQVMGGVVLALWSGSAATLLALAFAVAMIKALWTSQVWRQVPLFAGAALAIPHLAFAIGFSFLIMPSGLIARLLVGGDAPPRWLTTQDPWGLALIAVLALKEAPFLVLLLWSALSQGDAARRFAAEVKVARSLGHGIASIWRRVLLPQLLRRIAWPIVIVWVYGVTVVDLALVIGPTQPPTLAVTLLNDLNDADAAINARGSAGAAALTLLLMAIAALIFSTLRLARPTITYYLTVGPARVVQAGPALIRPIGHLLPWLRHGRRRKTFVRLLPKGDEGSFSMRHGQMRGSVLAAAIALIYVLVIFILVLLSFTPRWPYPALFGEGPGLAAWGRLALAPLVLSIGLALATAVTAVAMMVLWFETTRQASDRLLLPLAIAALAVPAITLAAGQYRLLLAFDLTGTLTGLFLVHLMPVLAYGFIVLAGPYRSFDERYTAAARALGAAPWRVLRAVKLPLLRQPLLTAFAVGFSVSLVQFVPAQLAAAGRYATLPMEAVTLASGGNRALTAAHALALALPALFTFGLAAYFGRARWR